MASRLIYSLVPVLGTSHNVAAVESDLLDLRNTRAPTARYPTEPMAPRSVRPGSDIANKSSTTEQIDNRLTSPTWDSSPNSMPGMFEANIRILPRLNPDYRNVVEYGIVAGRKILCLSLIHI